MSRTLCFVCSRCEHPICTREDLLMTTVTSGTTDNAFVYYLEDMLNLDTSVPCYSGTELAEENIVVSDKILELPMPLEARKLALGAVVNSHRFQEQLDGTDSVNASAEERRAPNDSLNVSLLSGEYGTLNTTEEMNAIADPPTVQAFSSNNTSESTTLSFGRFGRVQESRVDLICVREDVLMGGLVQCTKDRVTNSATALSMAEKRNVVDGETSVSAAASGNTTSSSRSGNGGGGDLGSTNNTTRTGTTSRSGSSLTQMPTAIVDAARRQPPPTRWSSHPGNFVVEEAFIKLRRRTKTARCPWFEAYECHGRLECPDCHLGLAYLFVRKVPTHNNTNTGNNDNDNNNSTVVKGASVEASLDGTCVEKVQEPHQKRERKEEEGRCYENSQHQTELESVMDFPDTFVGLELKRIRQCEWDLRSFQRRYQQAKDLKTFRELFPESEELESLHCRLRALRTQSELYNNLLCKHKEQIDVQSALLKSQKERMLTCEEKLRTMQEIIEAQRIQLEMQDRQIKHQEELVRNHKSQVVTQQHQIELEQLLLNEQSRTIASQREQIALIQDHLQTRLVREQLEARCGRLTALLQQAEEHRLAQTTNTTAHHRISHEALPSPHSHRTTPYHSFQEEQVGEGGSTQTRITFQQREEALRHDLPPHSVDSTDVGSGTEHGSGVESGERLLPSKAVSASLIAGRTRTPAPCSSDSVSGSDDGSDIESAVKNRRTITHPTAQERAYQRVALRTKVQGSSSTKTRPTENESESVDDTHTSV